MTLSVYSVYSVYSVCSVVNYLRRILWDDCENDREIFPNYTVSIQLDQSEKNADSQKLSSSQFGAQQTSLLPIGKKCCNISSGFRLNQLEPFCEI